MKSPIFFSVFCSIWSSGEEKKYEKYKNGVEFPPGDPESFADTSAPLSFGNCGTLVMQYVM